MNKSIEKYMYLLVEILIVATLAVFIYFNKNATVAFFCPIMQKMYVTKLIYLTLLIFVLSHTAGFALCAFFKTKVSALVDAYQKRHENISIEKDSDKAKIATLEAKIATLETALDNALNNK